MKLPVDDTLVKAREAVDRAKTQLVEKEAVVTKIANMKLKAKGNNKGQSTHRQ